MTAATPNPARLLVVDDEELVAHLLRRMLAEQGYQVEVAAGFHQVQAAFCQSTYDLVLLDILLPGINGLDILAWLKAHHPDTAVVMATAVEQLDVALAALRGGAVGYMLKPLNLDLVAEEVERALQGVRLKAANRAYQQRLELLVANRTRALSAAQVILQRQVRELTARDQVIRLQLSPPEDEREARREILAATGLLAAASAAWFFQLPVEAARPFPLATWVSAPPERGAGIAADDLGNEVSPPETVIALAVAAMQDRGRPALDEAGSLAVPVVYREQVLGVLAVTGTAAAETPWLGQALWRLAREAALVLRLVQVSRDLEAEQLGLASILAGPALAREESPEEDPWPAS